MERTAKHPTRRLSLTSTGQDSHSSNTMGRHEPRSRRLSLSTGKPKKSKLDKIFELEASLKVAKEENRRLRTQIESASHHPAGQDSVASLSSGLMSTVSQSDQIEKMKSVIQALRNVAAQQERHLYNMKAKATERRKEIDTKDRLIATMQKQIESLQKMQSAMESNPSEDSALAQLRQLQLEHFEAQRRNARLTQQLDEARSINESLESRLRTLGPARRSSEMSLSMVSDISSSTGKNDHDISKLKRELETKSRYTTELEMRIESMEQQMHELKQQQRYQPQQQQTRTHVDPFVMGDDPFFSGIAASKPFHVPTDETDEETYHSGTFVSHTMDGDHSDFDPDFEAEFW